MATSTRVGLPEERRSVLTLLAWSSLSILSGCASPPVPFYGPAGKEDGESVVAQTTQPVEKGTGQ